MTSSPNLGLPYIDQNQSQKHVTHNEALKLLDGMVQISVKGRTTTTPPGSPAEGERWIVPEGATGPWLGKNDHVALFKDGYWTYFMPRPGWIAFVENEGMVVYAAGAWQSYIVLTNNGAAIGMDIREEEIICSGPTATTSIVIPSRSIVLAASVRTTQAITGASSYDCGIVGEQSKFGGSLGVALGSTNIGVIGPTAFYSDTPIVLTANGGDFTGGKVRVAAQILNFAAPSQ
jgi:hypothetical protein